MSKILNKLCCYYSVQNWIVSDMDADHSEVLQKLLSKSINLIVPVKQETKKLQVSVQSIYYSIIKNGSN